MQKNKFQLVHLVNEQQCVNVNISSEMRMMGMSNFETQTRRRKNISHRWGTHLTQSEVENLFLLKAFENVSIISRLMEKWDFSLSFSGKEGPSPMTRDRS